jgi:hypothetical protein
VNKASKNQTAREEQAKMITHRQTEIRGIEQAPVAEADLGRVHSNEILVRAEGVNKGSNKHTVMEEQAGMKNYGQSEVRGIDQDPMAEEDPGQAEIVAASTKTNSSKQLSSYEYQRTGNHRGGSNECSWKE